MKSCACGCCRCQACDATAPRRVRRAVCSLLQSRGVLRAWQVRPLTVTDTAPRKPWPRSPQPLSAKHTSMGPRGGGALGGGLGGNGGGGGVLGKGGGVGEGGGFAGTVVIDNGEGGGRGDYRDARANEAHQSTPLHNTTRPYGETARGQARPPPQGPGIHANITQPTNRQSMLANHQSCCSNQTRARAPHPLVVMALCRRPCHHC